MHPIRYAWFSARELEASLGPTARVNVGGFEYHPRVHGWHGAELVSYLAELDPSPGASEWQAGDYAVRRLDPPEFEKGWRVYRVHATRVATAILPVAYARFVRAKRIAAEGATRLETYRTDDDPRIHVDVGVGDTDIMIRFPTVWSLIFGG
jgi:hypothetical protein